jgi:hypothetical protein
VVAKEFGFPSLSASSRSREIRFPIAEVIAPPVTSEWMVSTKRYQILDLDWLLRYRWAKSRVVTSTVS